AEMKDINQTARTALKEVREMVSDMRGIKLNDEIIHIRQMLEAAQINYNIEGSPELIDTPLLIENVLSMCLKEAVTNVVKHSEATSCNIVIKQSAEERQIKFCDNGIGSDEMGLSSAHGLRGMRERLEFVNGSMEVDSSD